MENNTLTSYQNILTKCKEIFLKKNKDYGSSWTILRLSSLTDQIFIKAKRIRNIQESQINLVGDSESDEFQSIINYCIMAMIVAEGRVAIDENYAENELSTLYDTYAERTKELMQIKNTDYGEVWRDMRVSSMTDLILSKLLRIKQIEDNGGKTTISEGYFSNFQDIMNYAIFCLILLKENTEK